MIFQKRIQVYFDDCDPAGIVLFANQFKLAHRLIEDFVVDKGISWNEWFQNKSFGVPLVNAEATYLQPLFQGNTYNGKVSISSMGESSVVFNTVLESLDEKECSRIKTVHVFTDLKSMRKTAIPTDIRKKLEV